MRSNDWTPVTICLPEDFKVVQVTYISAIDSTPCCDAFAFNNRGDWYWIDEIRPDEFTVENFEKYGLPPKAKVEITAWKYNCEPYMA